MKVALAFCMVFVFVATTPVKDVRQEYIVLQDDDGKYHVEDVASRPDPSGRASSSDVTFYLYTRDNPDNPDVIPSANFNAISATHFKSRRKSAFISHGWRNNYMSGVNTNIRPAIITMHDVNVFVVDWSSPANKKYTTAKAAVPVVGQLVGDFINHIISSYGISPSDIHLIGHSLGAHIAGCAGAVVNGSVDSIVGLDPALPLFDNNRLENRLDTSDGRFVHVIHTNGGKLGFSRAIGHADYYPNGGSSQPGCGQDPAGTCAHGRSYKYAAESILNSDSFLATKCDSQKKFENGSCGCNLRSRMGHFLIDRTASGSYYLTTNSASPYSQT